jgi:RHS repeat-associated protein
MSEPQFYATETECNYYFGSKLIKNNNGWVYSDRLSSIGKFYPYGIERPSATTNGTEKFTGYFRDSESGNDYADQRYTSPGMGRFITPDPLGGGHPADPSSWNKYAYTRGDPINRKDPGGNYDCTVGVGDYAETTDCEDVTVYAGPANPQCMLLLQAASGSPANPVAQEQYETYCAQVGGPSPTPAPVAQQPICTLTLYGRGIDTSGQGGAGSAIVLHVYLQFTSNGINGLPTLETIEGINPGTGLLSAWDPQNSNGLSANNPGSDANLGSITGSWVCGLLQGLDAAVTAIQQAGAPYDARGSGAPNSNSAMHYILSSVLQAQFYTDTGTLSGPAFTIPSTVQEYGWNTPIPGLN